MYKLDNASELTKAMNQSKCVTSKQNECKKGNHRKTELMKICETCNEYSVVSYLFDKGPSTRGDIVKGTPVKWTTAHDSLVRLQVKGIVKRDIVSQGRGRPKVYWSLKD
ncbi:MAG: hypothetical protein ACXAEU_08065 [Candidatus Hodarchaeales archaeon]|jgi:predicted transcriptional regulator